MLAHVMAEGCLKCIHMLIKMVYQMKHAIIIKQRINLVRNSINAVLARLLESAISSQIIRNLLFLNMVSHSFWFYFFIALIGLLLDLKIIISSSVTFDKHQAQNQILDLEWSNNAHDY